VKGNIMAGTRPAPVALLASLALALASPLAFGQTATTGTAPAPATTTTTTSTAPATSQPATATNPESRLVSQFTELAGSKENAASLVSGLRTGSAITLTEPVATSGQAPTSTPAPGTAATAATAGTTFTAPTKPMGYGNVRIALNLAKAQLASLGITNPTPEQLQTALVGTSGPGGTGTQSGILQMRADGMGWGKIANTMGVKLGAVMSGKQTWPAPGTSTTPTSDSSGVTTAAGSSGKGSGITTAAGSTGKGSGVTTAAGHSGGKHSGITTAAGGTVRSGSVTTGLGHVQGGGNAYGHVSRGAVNAGGGQAGGMAGAGGNGHGGGKH
jgi:hypothetical protein